jgi:hypothetical protein
MRTLGFFAGTLVVAAVSLFLGLRPGVLPDPAVGEASGFSPPERSPAGNQAANQAIVAGPLEAPTPEDAPSPVESADASVTPVVVRANEPAADTGQAPSEDPEPVIAGNQEDTDVTVDGPPVHWEAFFTPFRSQASAEGFARFLQSATGRVFRVEKTGPGDYRVWFRVDVGESRIERIAEIERVTGMTLAGGEL